MSTVTADMLSEASHDVLSATRILRGSTDSVVLARAASDNRVLVTFDGDFGELVYKLGSTPPPGVIYIREDPSSPEEAAELLLKLFVSAAEIDGYFTVLARGGIRQRLLPKK